MRWSELLLSVTASVNNENQDIDIQGLSFDSRKVQPGDVFFCIPGMHIDGHQFAGQAAQRGAAALVVEHYISDVNLPQAKVSDVRESMARMAAAFYGNPADELQLIGVTGTKGKTTTTYLIRAIGDTCGKKVGIIGTINANLNGMELYRGMTTPDPIDLQRVLRQMADLGADWVAMEVSAHALHLRKLHGLRFDVGIFTNLTRDHLDDFETMERYFAAKRTFFTSGMTQKSIINMDDPYGQELLSWLPMDVVRYGMNNAQADVYAAESVVNEKGIAYNLEYGGICIPVRMLLKGRFNVYNSLGAAAACLILGVSAQAVAIGLADASVPGRCETIPLDTPYQVIVDYAHTPDSLENILTTVSAITPGRLILVFGCGGDRDTGKRPVMGEIAGRLSDYCVITSDNPRGENQMDIIDQIRAGIEKTSCPYICIESRRPAIVHALQFALPGDSIVIAGKGHEDYQEINGIKYPFDDRAVVLELVREMR